MDRPSRRRFLAGIGGIGGVASAAGCTGLFHSGEPDVLWGATAESPPSYFEWVPPVTAFEENEVYASRLDLQFLLDAKRFEPFVSEIYSRSPPSDAGLFRESLRANALTVAPGFYGSDAAGIGWIVRSDDPPTEEILRVNGRAVLLGDYADADLVGTVERNGFERVGSYGGFECFESELMGVAITDDAICTTHFRGEHSVDELYPLIDARNDDGRLLDDPDAREYATMLRERDLTLHGFTPAGTIPGEPDEAPSGPIEWLAQSCTVGDRRIPGSLAFVYEHERDVDDRAAIGTAVGGMARNSSIAIDGRRVRFDGRVSYGDVISMQ